MFGFSGSANLWCIKEQLHLLAHHSSSSNMFKFILIAALTVSVTQAFPGGYIAKGGVYHPKETPSYMHAAKQASKKNF